MFVRTGGRARRGGALGAIYSRLVELGIVGKDMVRCGCRWVLGDEAAHPACATRWVRAATILYRPKRKMCIIARVRRRGRAICSLGTLSRNKYCLGRACGNGKAACRPDGKGGKECVKSVLVYKELTG